MEDRRGRALRNQDFLLDPDSVHITQGSWGTAPKNVQEHRERLLRELEGCPDVVFRFELDKRFYSSIEAAATFLNMDPKNTVLVDNATTAINTVLKSLPLQKGDGILVYSWTYKAILHACLDTAEKAGAEVITVELKLPLTSKEEVLKLYRKALQEHSNIKVAVLDHISSATATLFPITELINLCKEFHVISIIDGAHAPGQVPLDVENWGCDFFAGNLHKWSFVPRGCAVLWVNPKHHSILRPLVTSHNYKCHEKTGDFRADFLTQGTKDYTPYYCIEEAVKFYKGLGGMEAIHSYTSSTLDEAVDKLVWLWGTRKFPIPDKMMAPYMRLIELPYVEKYHPTHIAPGAVFGDMPLLISDMWFKYKIMTTMLLIEGKPYVRICCHAYNYPEEFVKLGDAMLALKRQAEKETDNKS